MWCVTSSDCAASVCYLAVYKSSDWDFFFFYLLEVQNSTQLLFGAYINMKVDQ